MLRLNLELQDAAAQSDEFLRESLPIDPALFATVFLGRVVPVDYVELEESPCWTSPYPWPAAPPRAPHGSGAWLLGGLAVGALRGVVVGEAGKFSAHPADSCTLTHRTG